MTIETIVRDSALYENFHFADAVASDGFLFCSGIIGMSARGGVPDDVKEEFRNA